MPTRLTSSLSELVPVHPTMGQVHRAVTKSGKEVAVKMQYPGLENQVRR